MKTPTPDELRAGLCATCVHHAVVTSARGSTFYRCGLAETDPRFPKYPRLPVIVCPGYERSLAGIRD